MVLVNAEAEEVAAVGCGFSCLARSPCGSNEKAATRPASKVTRNQRMPRTPTGGIAWREARNNHILPVGNCQKNRLGAMPIALTQKGLRIDDNLFPCFQSGFDLDQRVITLTQCQLALLDLVVRHDKAFAVGSMAVFSNQRFNRHGQNVPR